MTGAGLLPSLSPPKSCPFEKVTESRTKSGVNELTVVLQLRLIHDEIAPPAVVAVARVLNEYSCDVLPYACIVLYLGKRYFDHRPAGGYVNDPARVAIRVATSKCG